jgi:hypothetical protein
MNIPNLIAYVVMAGLAYLLFRVTNGIVVPLFWDTRLGPDALECIVFRRIVVSRLPYTDIDSIAPTTRLAAALARPKDVGTVFSIINRSKPLVMVRRRRRAGSWLLSPPQRDAFIHALTQRIEAVVRY